MTTEWMCMVADLPSDLICDYDNCELRCPYRVVREKLEGIEKEINEYYDNEDWIYDRIVLADSHLDEIKRILEVK